MLGTLTHPSCLPGRHLVWREERKRQSGCLGKSPKDAEEKNNNKSQKCTQCILPVPAECFASQTVNSADVSINLVHSFISTGYESLCLHVSFIKSLERVIKLLTLNIWVYTVVKDNLSVRGYLILRFLIKFEC